MKTRFLLIVALAAAVLAGCKEQKSEPSAMEVLMTRTSIRSFTDEAIPRDQLETILRAGMAAPSGMNVQPWRFVVVTDKQRITELWGGGFRPETYTSAGAVILVCGQTSFMRKPWGQPDAPEELQQNPFWYEDCSAAAENILLAAHALGLGAVWTAGYPAMERVASIASALGIPDDVVPLCVIPVGVPAEKLEPKDKWKPENIHWEKW